MTPTTTISDTASVGTPIVGLIAVLFVLVFIAMAVLPVRRPVRSISEPPRHVTNLRPRPHDWQGNE